MFLRKLKHYFTVPFSYNKIDIVSRKELHNRMMFLESESDYRSYRANQLFHQLQCVVNPSIIDDIRYMHSIVYTKEWNHRESFWSSQFYQIQWEESRVTSSHADGSYNINDEIDATKSVNIKPEEVIIPKASPLARKDLKIVCEFKSQELTDENFESYVNERLRKIKKLFESIQSRKNRLSTVVQTKNFQDENVDVDPCEYSRLCLCESEEISDSSYTSGPPTGNR